MKKLILLTALLVLAGLLLLGCTPSEKESESNSLPTASVPTPDTSKQETEAPQDESNAVTKETEQEVSTPAVPDTTVPVTEAPETTEISQSPVVDTEAETDDVSELETQEEIVASGAAAGIGGH